MKARKNPHLFPDTFYKATLETWAAAIQQLPCEAKQCLLDQVVHYKALSDMEHEFLVVYATHPSGSQIVLGVDRNAERDVTRATTTSSESQSQQPSSSASGATATATGSSSLSSSARYLGTLITSFSSQPSSSDEDENEEGSSSSPRPAYDGVQVSHDGTPAPILAHNGRSVALSTITFTSSHASQSQSPTRTVSASSQEDPEPSHHRPSLLHLSVLLLAIRTHFPSYALLQYQCYFFARAACLSLIDLFRGTETELEEGRRASTWRGVHVSLYSAGRAALQNMLLLPLAEFPALIVPAGLFAVYSAVKLYDGNVVENEVDRRRIRCEFIAFRATS
jgi:hypothetical protein